MRAPTINLVEVDAIVKWLAAFWLLAFAITLVMDRPPVLVLAFAQVIGLRYGLRTSAWRRV